MLTGLAFVVGCSSTTPNLSPGSGQGGGGGTIPTATPVGSHTATPTPIPIGPTATPTGGGINSIACNVPTAALPGTYVSFITEGLTTGSTYVEDTGGSNEWSVDSYVAATPAPTGTPTAVPTATPSGTPTPAPTATPTPLMYSVFYGTATTPTFNAAGTTVPAQTNCFFFEVAQPVGGTIAQFRGNVPRAAATANPNDNSIGFGEPNITQDYTLTNVSSGAITTFSLTNLSLSKQTGSGTFTLDNGTAGSVVIQGAASTVEALPAGVRRAYLHQQAMRSHLIRH